MIQSTSLEAYHVIEPDLGNKQRIIYEALQRHPDSSNHDLSKFLGWEINSITPRVKELRDKGLVICSGSKTDVGTNMNVMTWKTVSC